MLTVGLLINPVAGLGGSVALKGSDGADVQALARERGGQSRGADRAKRALTACGTAARSIRWLVWGGEMGGDLLREMGLDAHVLGTPPPVSSADDSRLAARAMLEAGADLILFCGGDGTARDLLAELGQRIPVLGVPAGVKMHSGVFATTPESAGEILAVLVAGGLVRAATAEVRDLDEAALREGTVRPRFHGELAVPELGGFLQHTKEGGRENEALALEEIVAEVRERVAAGPGPYLLGPGSTMAAIKTALGLDATLIGVDVLHHGRQAGKDVDAAWLERYLARDAESLPAAQAEPSRPVIVLSFTRQQGFLLGRGNQQFSPAVLRRVGRANVWVVGTRTKLLSLSGRPLLIDTDDADLDRDWSGLAEVITGYDDRVYHLLDSRV